MRSFRTSALQGGEHISVHVRRFATFTTHPDARRFGAAGSTGGSAGSGSGVGAWANALAIMSSARRFSSSMAS